MRAAEAGPAASGPEGTLRSIGGLSAVCRFVRGSARNALGAPSPTIACVLIRQGDRDRRPSCRVSPVPAHGRRIREVPRLAAQPAAEAKVYLHIGEPKTGTTFIQQVMWSNRAELAAQGVVLPGHHPQDHFRA